MYNKTHKHTYIQSRIISALLAAFLALPTAAAGAAAEATSATEVTAGATADARVTIVSDMRYAIDFNYLKEAAPNGVAWLYQPNTTINQPIMHSDDPTYYLKRLFNGELDVNGALFTTGDEPDFSAPSITIYGRNRLDYTMFGSLSNYSEDEYYKANPTLYLLTPDGDYRLDVFAGIRTRLSDRQSWRVSETSVETLYQDDLPRVLESSFIEPLASALPELGDSWAVLSTESPQSGGSRYVIYARKRPIRYDTENVAYVNQMEMDSRATVSGRVSVDGVGEWMLYAQNDPTWNRLVFEVQNSSRRRPFGDGGCGPTSIAIALANLVETDELTKLGLFASSPLGYRFCSCSVNEYHCSSEHLPYQLTTPEDYARYLPIAVGNFAMGNNIWGVRGRVDRYGTNMSYLDKICAIFGITVTQTYDINEALSFLKNGDSLAIACTSSQDSPFTNSSHFLVLAEVDDEYLYILDPLRRKSYAEWDSYGNLELLEPGLVRVKLEKAGKCSLRPVYMLERKAR